MCGGGDVKRERRGRGRGGQKITIKKTRGRICALEGKRAGRGDVTPEWRETCGKTVPELGKGEEGALDRLFLTMDESIQNAKC